MLDKFERGVRLADHTTIGLGGEAAYFRLCRSVSDLADSLSAARKHGMRHVVLGGGSNIIFADEGFDGIVLKIAISGIDFHDSNDTVLASVAAGEIWDDFVRLCISRGLSGVESLSGIPGLAGATPVQNVGAYGREVSQTITAVNILDTVSFEEKRFSPADCMFGYRNSRFKYNDRDRYIITGVQFRLMRAGEITTDYPELTELLSGRGETDTSDRRERLEMIRNAVIELRKKKSMVLDPLDPDTHSCGSFFLNPILSEAEFRDFQRRLPDNASDSEKKIPFFKTDLRYKIAAAWLLEQAGFKKGHSYGGVGISRNHSLALVNRGGSAREILEFSERIEARVYELFGIRLQREPSVIPATGKITETETVSGSGQGIKTI